MTKKEFERQVWMRGDKVLLTDGIEYKVNSVGFGSCFVRVPRNTSEEVSGEWVKCAEIESHTHADGSSDEDMAEIIGRLRQQLKTLQANYDKLSAVKMDKSVCDTINRVKGMICNMASIPDMIEKQNMMLTKLCEALADAQPYKEETDSLDSLFTNLLKEEDNDRQD